MTSTYADRVRGVTTTVAVKAPVRVATTANITLSGLQTINGVALAVGDRVLVKDQTDARENGVWVAAFTDWSRAEDFNGAFDCVQGTWIYETVAARHWRLTSPADPIIGTSDLVFSRLFGPQSFYAVESASELAQLDTAEITIAHLSGRSNWEWDPTVAAATHQADEYQMAFVAPDADEDGAWVDPLADSRRGYWTNSAVPALKHRVSSGIFSGKNAAIFRGATDGNNGNTEFWAHDEPIDGWWVGNAGNLFERDAVGINTSIVTRGPTNVAGQTIGLLLGTVGRNANSTNSILSAYIESVANAEHAANAGGIEIDIVNKSGPSSISGGETPYTIASKLRMGLNIASGGDQTVHGLTDDTDHAIRITGNGSRFKSGVTFRSTSLVDDGNGESRALSLAQGHALVWFGPSDVETMRLLCTAGSGGPWRIAFGGVGAFQHAGQFVAQLEPVANAANYINIRAAAASSPPAIEAKGSDTNIDLYLISKGTGLLRFSYAPVAATTPGNFSANRRIAVKDGNGNTLYIAASTTTW